MFHSAAKHFECTLQFHRKNPAFRRYLAEHDIGAVSLDSLKSFPVMTKEDFRDLIDCGVAHIPKKQLRTRVTTSGTTNSNRKTTVHYTYDCVRHGFAETAIRALLMAGVLPHLSVGYYITPTFPGHPEPASHVKTMAVAQVVGKDLIIDESVRHSAGYHIEKMVKTNPDYIMSAPNYLLYVMNRAKQAGIASLQDYAALKGKNCSKKTIWYGGAPLQDARRAQMEAFYNADIVGFYASTEGRIMGAQVRGSDNYYIFLDKVHMEVVDDNGDDVPSGSRGKILITPYFHGSPLVRYELGDEAEVVLRTRHTLIIRDIRRSGEIFLGDAIVSYAELEHIRQRLGALADVGNIQLVKRQQEAMEIVLKIEADDNSALIKQKARNLFYRNYQVRVLTDLGVLPPVKIEVVPMDGLLGEGYKHKLYIEDSRHELVT